MWHHVKVRVSGWLHGLQSLSLKMPVTGSKYSFMPSLFSPILMRQTSSSQMITVWRLSPDNWVFMYTVCPKRDSGLVRWTPWTIYHCSENIAGNTQRHDVIRYPIKSWTVKFDVWALGGQSWKGLWSYCGKEKDIASVPLMLQRLKGVLPVCVIKLWWMRRNCKQLHIGKHQWGSLLGLVSRAKLPQIW